MTEDNAVGRRAVLKLLGAAPLAGGFLLSEAQAQTAHERIARQKSPAGAYVPKFFSPHEWATVRLLADMVIPRDARSGSATDAKVPEFMDTLFADPDASPASPNAVHPPSTDRMVPVM